MESGKLLSLSAYEADLTHADATGHAVTSVFVVDQNTRGVTAVAKGDTVNVLYLADGSSRRALMIRVIRSPSWDKGFSGEVGGVARLERPAPDGSLTAADATSLKRELESSFGISAATGATAAVVLRSHQLLASTSSSLAPWNIYVDGDLETSVAATPQGEVRHGGGYDADLRLGTDRGAAHSYMVAGDRLRLISILVTGNGVLLKLTASSSSSKPIYSTLAFPITSGSSAKLIEQQISAMLQATPSQ